MPEKRINEILQAYGITAKDLGVPIRVRTPIEPTYRDADRALMGTPFSPEDLGITRDATESGEPAKKLAYQL
jgi:hypothetical protein